MLVVVVGLLLVVVGAAVLVVVPGRVVVVVVGLTLVAVDGAAVVLVVGVVVELVATDVVTVNPGTLVVVTWPLVRTGVGVFLLPEPRAVTPIRPASTHTAIWAPFGHERNLRQTALGPDGSAVPVGSITT